MEPVKIIGTCPICSELVGLYHLNLDELVLMCKGIYCDFPFGYEDLQVVTNQNELQESASNVAMGPYAVQSTASSAFSTASSSISTAAWSDLEKLNKIYDSEDSTADSRVSYTSNAVKMHKEKRKTQKRIQKNLDRIKKLNEELNRLKNMDHTQDDDKEDEQKKHEPDFGMGELKINITTVPNDDGLINIEIINEENQSENKKDCGDTRGENQNEKKTNLADNQQANTFKEPMNTESKMEENQINNDNNTKEIPFNDSLPNQNKNLNEINNFDVCNLVVVQVINSQNETENIEEDFEMDGDNINQSNISNERKIGSTVHDTIINNLTIANEGKNEGTEARNGAIKKKVYPSSKTKKLKESDMNYSKDRDDVMNNSKESDVSNTSKESDGEVKILKKRNKLTTGKKVQEQPLRRSSRLSKK